MGPIWKGWGSSEEEKMGGLSLEEVWGLDLIMEKAARRLYGKAKEMADVGCH